MKFDEAGLGAAVGIARAGRMSQTALATAMRDRGHKWSQATIWSLEAGERTLKASEAWDVADILGIDIKELFEPAMETMAQARAEAAVTAAAAHLREAAAQYERAREELRELVGLSKPGPSVTNGRVLYWMTRPASDVVSAEHDG